MAHKTIPIATKIALVVAMGSTTFFTCSFTYPYPLLITGSIKTGGRGILILITCVER